MLTRAYILLCMILLQLCLSDNLEEFFDFDSGAWILCRKLIDGVNGNFGVGYRFTVTYELINVGTQKAHNIKIEDSWDTQYFKPYYTQVMYNLLLSISIIFSHQ